MTASTASDSYPPTGRALRLRRPFGRTLLGAGLLLLALAVVAEGVARLPAVQARFPFHSTNNPNSQFDDWLTELEQIAAREGGLDCLVLGSSLVGAGYSRFDFEWGYAAAEGADPPLRCVQLGMSGMAAEQVGVVARLMVTLYQPRLLIYGTSARDFNDKLTDQTFNAGNDFTQGAWVRYRLGDAWSLDGWLVEHSRAYRYVLNLRHWLHAAHYSRNGPLPPPPVVSEPADPVDEANQFEALDGFTISQRGLAGLATLLALQARGPQVVVVEMPLHPTYLDFLDDGEATLAAWREAVQAATEAGGGTFVSAQLELTIPDDGWYDRLHLEGPGRLVFSEWLGRTAAEEGWGAP